ncbi:MAG: hypothetical protein E6G10_16615 [Actinobacteria bacterium]|nr:MAG: hypothetical protein E6G10_16615 [Actinomycetota bacterium]
MQGLRCPSCGETRWHLLPVALEARHECAICGAEMVVERRRPGRGPKLLPGERRRGAALSVEATPPPAAPA